MECGLTDPPVKTSQRTLHGEEGSHLDLRCEMGVAVVKKALWSSRCDKKRFQGQRGERRRKIGRLAGLRVM